MMLGYSVAWIPLVILAIINGSLREFGYAPYVSELHAHQVSTITGIMISGIYMSLLFRYRPLACAAQALRVGVLWVSLTVAFEFLFGHYVAGHSWERLVSDYNLLAGRVWPAFLAWIAAAPYLFFRLAGKTRTGSTR